MPELLPLMTRKSVGGNDQLLYRGQRQLLCFEDSWDEGMSQELFQERKGRGGV